jgi:hypothetical protein
MTKLKVVTGIFATVLLFLGAFFVAVNAAPTTNFTVTKTADNLSTGTLRWAITQANSNGVVDTIFFNIPTSDPNYDSSNGWWTITISSTLGTLPSLTESGTTINGYTTDTNPTGLEIVIDSSFMVGAQPILTIESDYNTVMGLTLVKGPGPGINIIKGASNNTIIDNYIGTNPNGELIQGNGAGVIISSGAHHNTIDQCVISGNDENGVLITGDNTNYNILQRTIIGLNASGTGKIPNGWDGVHITNGADHNTIGGELPTDDGRGNVISGNNQRGVYLSGEDTIYNGIQFNYIGVNKSGGGTPDVGNLSDGIMLENGPDANSILFNVISGNKRHGIYLRGTGTSQTWISENIIGADPELKAIIPNHNHGVAVYDGAYSNYIGGHSWMKGNVIVGSGYSGIAVVGSWDNDINDNVIGTDRPFSPKKMGNKYHGIDIVNSRENEIWENHIAYNGTHSVWAGIEVEGSTAISNTISMNSIHDNTGGGIDLVSGGNNNLPAPLITTAGCTIVQGVTSCLGCRIEIFSDGGAEGKYYEGYTIATSPNFIWGGTVRGPNVTVTATDYKWWDATDYKNTSEFSLPWLGACHTVYLPVTYKNY